MALTFSSRPPMRWLLALSIAIGAAACTSHPASMVSGTGGAGPGSGGNGDAGNTALGGSAGTAGGGGQAGALPTTGSGGTAGTTGGSGGAGAGTGGATGGGGSGGIGATAGTGGGTAGAGGQPFKTISFGPSPATLFRPQNTAYIADGASFALADLNGDGKLDLVTFLPETSTQTFPGFELFLNAGNGVTGQIWQQSPTTLFRPQNTAYIADGASFALADLDGDGRLDLVTFLPETSTQTFPGFEVFLNTSQ